MTRAKIVGVGAYAPKRILSHADLEKMVDTNDAWIVQRSGIRERHIADETEATSDLALKAAQQAIERANLVPEDIEFIAVGTTTPDMIFPSVGNILQHRLGCKRIGSIDMMVASSVVLPPVPPVTRFPIETRRSPIRPATGALNSVNCRSSSACRTAPR